MLSVVQELRDPVGDDGGARHRFYKTQPLSSSQDLASFTPCRVFHYLTVLLSIGCINMPHWLHVMMGHGGGKDDVCMWR